MKVPFLDVRAGQAELRRELQQAFDRVLDSGRYVLGPELELFEEEFARFCGTRNAVGVGTGLDALTILLRASGIGPGDEVLVPAYTFVATWLAVIHSGARVVPVDVVDDTLSIDPDAATAACNPRTAAIIPVHLYGRPVHMRPLEELARRHGLLLLGDAAQAHGAQTSGRPVGALGTAAAFSFYPSKNLGALGDGGAVTTNDNALADAVRRLRNYGSATKHNITDIGVNSRLDPLQAALLRVKLSVLPEWNRRRAQVAVTYLDQLARVAHVDLPPRPAIGEVHAWHLFCIRHPYRDALADFLHQRDVATQVHYPMPPHLTPAFEHLGYPRGSFPVTESAAATALSLPIGPHLPQASVAAVVHAIRDFPG